MKLPEKYVESLGREFGPEAERLLASYEQEAQAGLRVNTGKRKGGKSISFLEKCERVPWTEAGYYLPQGSQPGKHPLYFAGAYYIQEPSAMAPAEFLPIQEGDRVLDLCAAPGGKSTRLAEKLKGSGLLLANDISASRAQALLRNLERFGAGNILVTAESPQRLREVYPESFDKILVDAPCSGEGMFRREPSLLADWIKRGPSYYVPIQREILEEAVAMLRPGGLLLYSTCTFSAEEDENQLESFLNRHPECEEVALSSHPLYQDELWSVRVGLKFLPHRLRGEGHYLAMVRKKEAPDRSDESRPRTCSPKQTPLPYEEIFSFLSQIAVSLERERLFIKKDLVYYLPEGGLPQAGLRYLRTGLLLGQLKRNRFEPSQALAMWLKREHFPNTADFTEGDIACVKYLKGETISDETALCTGGDGWTLICVEGLPLGFAKRSGHLCKNKIDPGWRWE